jgi:hypothetical protein
MSRLYTDVPDKRPQHRREIKSKERSAREDVLLDLSRLTYAKNALLGAAVSNLYLIFVNGASDDRAEATNFLSKLSHRVAEAQVDDAAEGGAK